MRLRWLSDGPRLVPQGLCTLAVTHYSVSKWPAALRGYNVRSHVASKVAGKMSVFLCGSALEAYFTQA
jgi:hypothetical protein